MRAGLKDEAPRRRGLTAPLMGCCAAGMLALASVAVAHHSFAMFDQARQLSLQGTVQNFQWTNPHSWIYLDVRHADGGLETWQIEMNSPNNLRRQGWRPRTLKPGDQVTVVINPLRDGHKGGLFVSVKLPDGSVIRDPTRRGNAPINVPVVK
jgi:Family of unknown function (DUF6152)